MGSLVGWCLYLTPIQTNLIFPIGAIENATFRFDERSPEKSLSWTKIALVWRSLNPPCTLVLGSLLSVKACYD